MTRRPVRTTTWRRWVRKGAGRAGRRGVVCLRVGLEERKAWQVPDEVSAVGLSERAERSAS